MIYAIFFFLLIVAFLRFTPLFRFQGSLPWVMPIGFAIKSAVGILFLYIYTYHYGVGELTADGSEFMKDSKILNSVFYESPLDYFRFLIGWNDKEMVAKYLSETVQWDTSSEKYINDTRNVLRLHSVIHFFSYGMNTIHLMVMALINVIGFRWIAIAIQPYTKLKSAFIFFVLLLMPNVLFWTSGILKEPIIIFNFGLFLYASLLPHHLLKKIVLILVSIVGLLSMKPYLLLCVLPAIVGYLLLSVVKNKKLGITILIGLTVASIASLLTKPMRPVVNKLSFQQYDFDNIGKGGVYASADTCVFVIYGQDMQYTIVDEVDSTVYLTHEVVGDYVRYKSDFTKTRCTIQPNEKPWKLFYDGTFSGSYIETTLIRDSPIQLLKNIPEALINVFVRPFPNDPPHSKFKYVTLIDTWGMLLLLIVVILFYRRTITNTEFKLIVSMLIFCLVLALLIGWTTPVLGAIVRYKVPIQVAMMLITLILFNPQKIFKNHD